MNDAIQMPRLLLYPLHKRVHRWSIAHIHLLIVNRDATTACGHQCCTLRGIELRSTYQENSGLLHLLGYLLDKESCQSPGSSNDEIAASLFPRERGFFWSCLNRSGMLLPQFHPALPIPIADVQLLRSVLVLAQLGQQGFFICLSFYFNQLSG